MLAIILGSTRVSSKASLPRRVTVTMVDVGEAGMVLGRINSYPDKGGLEVIPSFPCIQTKILFGRSEVRIKCVRSHIDGPRIILFHG